MSKRLSIKVKNKIKALLVFLFYSPSLLARSTGGAVDYSGNSGRLVDAAEFVLMYCSYAVDICYAIASLLAMYSGTAIYIKMTNGEEGVIKNIEMLVGAMVFIVAATILFPAMFGWHTGVRATNLHGWF